MQLFFFRLHLVLHACAARFDVTRTAQNFLESKQAQRRNGAPVRQSSVAVVGRCVRHRSWASTRGRPCSCQFAMDLQCAVVLPADPAEWIDSAAVQGPWHARTRTDIRLSVLLLLLMQSCPRCPPCLRVWTWRLGRAPSIVPAARCQGTATATDCGSHGQLRSVLLRTHAS